MRSQSFIFLVGALVLTGWTCADTENGESTPVDFTSDVWSNQERLHQMFYLGQPAVVQNGGVATLGDVQFTNGRIDVDIAMHGHRGFAGLAFRYQNDAEFELVYFRTHKSGEVDAVQYVPRLNGMGPWQLYHEGYMGAADYSHNRWMHVRLEFIDRSLKVFVDDNQEAVLEVEDLQRDVQAGSIGIWGGTAMHFANFKYTVYADPKQKFQDLPLSLEAGTLARWAISPVFEAAVNPLTQAPATDMVYSPVKVEGKGFVNVSRYRAQTPNEQRVDPDQGKDLIYAQTSFYADQAGLKKLWLGYSDEVLVYLNGQPLYEGRSAFDYRAPSALGLLGMQNDALYLPLKKGKNTITLAVAEIFGGWGFMARFENPEGLRLD